ncbi:MAG: leader peptidase (prepilin peptidase) / N-methyltransferase [Moorella sp. (in: firmicutes)]|nr:leader peptidase (prepilin peptidase) / N-methyltransferase [Moorella sp. (in: firmicutes)]
MFWIEGFFFILGLFIGSFLNVVIYRLPRGETVVWGRSRCPACGRALAWYDLFPVLSYLFLRGRCRYCRLPISPRYPIVEIVTGVVFTTLFYNFGLSWVLVKYLFLGAMLVAASFIDLEHYLIPDSLVVTGACGGILFSLLARDVGLRSALGGTVAAAGFLLLVAVISNGGMGGGDVKLAGMVGLFLGWPLASLALFLSLVTGGLVGICLLVSGLKKRQDPLPFAPFIAIGGLLALFFGEKMLPWYLVRFM